ncbi:MAG: tRNA pseudouridine(55) synthase TruB [Holosporales bacterium]|jgi:tRNA pseudouridine55 synthase|nr:tRNA pseudouridine(55) synthase TruB [Holosporales bacterium]
MCDRKTSGILIIDKPEGKTSAVVDSICKKILNVKRVGHVGTLDPFATGVLVVAVNNGTKAIPYINPAKKTYEFTIKFGEKTNTGDKTGQIVETSNKRPAYLELENVIASFVGEVFQTPHAFSAIKIGGKRAYQIARQGGTPEIKPRKVTIFSLELVDKIDDSVFKMRTTVSPGTYIRSLCEDIAKTLGTVGHTHSLRRTRDGDFKEGQAVSLDELRENKSAALIPLESVLRDFLIVLLSNCEAESLAFGREIRCDSVLENDRYLAKSSNGFLGIVNVYDGVMKVERVLCLG